MPGPAGVFWTWPDAVLAALLAVCLAATSALLVARFTGPGRRATAVGPAVAAALVVAMAATLLTHGEPVARTVVLAATVVVCVLLAVVVRAALRARPRPARPERERHEVHNEIAGPDHRC